MNNQWDKKLETISVIGDKTGIGEMSYYVQFLVICPPGQANCLDVSPALELYRVCSLYDETEKGLSQIKEQYEILLQYIDDNFPPPKSVAVCV